MDSRNIEKDLFRSATRGKWNAFLRIYKIYPTVHVAKIDGSGNTALHIAVSNIQEAIVEELVGLVSAQGEPRKALEIRNEQGNTPLHVAASLGNVRMCECIVQADLLLLEIQNNVGETPLFVAALHGKKDAFLCLNAYCRNKKEGYSYCRRKDGENVLHCAISGNYFDLAFQIVYLYQNLVNYVNENGISPLHLLASKPTAFRSGSHLDCCSQLIYHCIFVDQLKAVESSFQQSSSYDQSKERMKMSYPDNYQTCMHLLHLLKLLVQVVTKSSHNKSQREDAVENLEAPNLTSDSDSEARSKGDKGPHRDGHQLFSPNCGTFIHFVKLLSINFVKLLSKAMFFILGLGSRRIRTLKEKKEKHTWAVQIMNKLLEHASMYQYEDSGGRPQLPLFGFDETIHDDFPEGVLFTHFAEPEKKKKTKDVTKRETPILNAAKSEITEDNGSRPQLSLYDFDETMHDEFPEGGNIKIFTHFAEPEKKEKTKDMTKIETPILIAAKSGITEMVERILELIPDAIHDMNSENKNIVLLAVENRQPLVYQLLFEKVLIMRDTVFGAVDQNGNTALHLAAELVDHEPWLIPGAALQMQREIMWYEFVKNSMTIHFFDRYNRDNKTPKDIFTETHKELIRNGGEWLVNISQSCSFVAALIATVAFATSTTVPGGVKQESGTPTLEFHSTFNVFAVSSLVAFCSSFTAVVIFLAILTSDGYQEKSFGKDLPRKLFFGFTSMFVSIASILVSFCAAHYFTVKDTLGVGALAMYAVACLPVAHFAITQFPLYHNLTLTTFKKVPMRYAHN
ncbi:hypothetical protein REPUB_Repub17cG0089400 [Reevesia pubescens]